MLSQRARRCSLALLIGVLALGSAVAQGRKKPKPPPDPPALPAGAWITFGASGGIWLSNGEENGLLLEGTGGPPTHSNWSPDGTRIACWQQDPVTGDWGVRLLEVDGSGTPQIVYTAVGQCNGLDWSGPNAPDGERLLFAENNSPTGRYDLCVVRPDGSDLFQLTADYGYMNAHWSPDGTQIVAVEIGGPQGFGLVVLDVGMISGQLAVTGRTYLTGPSLAVQSAYPWGSFSWDGNWVVLSDGSRIHRVNVHDPTNAVLVYDGIPSGHNELREPVFTPDDTQVLFSCPYRANREILATVDARGGSTAPTFLTRGFRSDQRIPDVKPN